MNSRISTVHKIFFFTLLTLLNFPSIAQQTVWISTTEKNHWSTKKVIAIESKKDSADVTILTSKPRQTITGFGGCFNELGWQSLLLLKPSDRAAILKELFAPGTGANFTLCRMPLGANDFSLDFYSYDEQDQDFDLKNFSISRDQRMLIPFIKEAKKYNPHLQLWASPWSPPQWMKKNGHYAEAMVPSMEVLKKYQASSGQPIVGLDFSHVQNGLKPEQTGKEGTEMFIQDDRYLNAYARYFGKFIDAYKHEGIHIGMVMPQNEFNSAQVFPSCTWTSAGLSRFISFLGPEMSQRGVKLFFGTVERANVKLVDSILTDPKSKNYISGVGFQWAGKGAIAGIHHDYPGLSLYQSEQECGDGQNDWKYCRYTWDLMKHYFNNGANAYMYWNISLKEGGISHWGWSQNSLVSVDTLARTYKFNHEYYLLKHLSHFVKPGARSLNISGSFNNLLAFKNPDKSIVIVVQNASNEDRNLKIKVGNKLISAFLEADSFNTIVLGDK